MAYQSILCLSGRRILEVQVDQVLGKPAVKGTVHSIQNEIQKVESRDERWWEVDVTCNRQVLVIFRVNGIGCCEN